MDVYHKIAINSKKDAEFLSVIKKIGIQHQILILPGGLSSLITFDITESDSRWETISKLIAEKGASDISETYFSDDEIRSAEWLRLVTAFEQGYPQPKLEWPLKQQSYEIRCPQCAIYRQSGPMRLAKEPHLGRKSFMSLIWCGEIFCKPEVIFELTGIHAQGYEVWDALIHKTGKPSEIVRQLYVPSVASSGVIFEDDLKRKTCTLCGTTKYYPHVKGILRIRREALLTDTDFMLIHEWFGHGLLAWREMLVSNRVAALFLDKGWQGVRFKVVEIV